MCQWELKCENQVSLKGSPMSERFFLHLYWTSTSWFCQPLLVKVLLCVSLELLLFAPYTSAVFSSFCFILVLCSMSEIKLGTCCM